MKSPARCLPAWSIVIAGVIATVYLTSGELSAPVSQVFLQWLAALEWGAELPSATLPYSDWASPIWLLWLKICSYLQDLPFFGHSEKSLLFLIKLAPLVATFAWGKFLADRRIPLALVGLLVFPLLFDAAAVGQHIALTIMMGCFLVQLLSSGQLAAAGALQAVLVALSPIGLVFLPFAVKTIVSDAHQTQRSLLRSALYVFVALLTYVAIFGVAAWWTGVNHFALMDVQASAGAYNFFALSGQLFTKISTGSLGVGGTWGAALGVLLSLSYLVFSKSKNNFAAGVTLALGATLVLPGMPAGAAMAACAFLPWLVKDRSIEQRDRLLRLFVLLAVVSLFELHLSFRRETGAQDFLRLFGTDPRHWLTPSLVWIVVAKVLLSILLWRRLEQQCQVPTDAEVSCETKPARHAFAYHILERIWQRWPSFVMQGRDWLLLMVVTIAALVMSFWNLGNHRLPQTGMPLSGTLQIKPAAGRSIQSIWLVKSHHYSRMQLGCIGEPRQFSKLLDIGNSYGYSRFDLQHPCPQGVELKFSRIKIERDLDFEGKLYEILLADDQWQIIRDGEICINTTCASLANHTLFDETAHLKEVPTRSDGAFFDEVFNIETAAKWLQFPGEPVLTTAHPFLGRAVIAMNIKAFGMTPWAWRMPGAIAGALIPAALFVLCGYLTGNRRVAAVSAGLALFDHARVGLAQMAIVDSQLILWIIIAHICLLIYTRSQLALLFEDKQFEDKRTLASKFPVRAILKGHDRFLILAAAFGVAISIKWIGVFVAPMIALVIGVLKSAQIYHSQMIKKPMLVWRHWLGAVSLVLVGVVIAAAIYGVSYLPFLSHAPAPSTPTKTISTSDLMPASASAPAAENSETSIEALVRHQKRMMRVHTMPTAFHRSSSEFSSWVFMDRPLLVDAQTGLSTKVVAESHIFGNPIVWWAMLPTFGVFFYLGFYRRNPAAGYVMLAFACQLLPWALIQRPGFIYHFYSAWIFGVAGVAMLIVHLSQRYRLLLPIYGTLVVVAFLWFYPLTNSTPIPIWRFYVSRWFDSWFF